MINNKNNLFHVVIEVNVVTAIELKFLYTIAASGCEEL